VLPPLKPRRLRDGRDSGPCDVPALRCHHYQGRSVRQRLSGEFVACCLRIVREGAIRGGCCAAALPTLPSRSVSDTLLEDKPWGMREFAIVDADGNLIRIWADDRT
jgi:hypothetical protein